MKKLKVLIPVILVLIPLAFPALLGADYTVAVSKRDDGSEISLRVGHRLEVRLEQPAGHSWEFVESNERLLAPQEPEGLTQKGTRGEGTFLRVWKFKAVQKGHVELKMNLVRGSDRQKAVSKFTIIVDIK